ncbi:hypothetical protein HRbin30_02801 [bacterium HR30]|nr:hypothetical protein HRbin30_02801 [bacterium HR30]
MKYGPYHPGVSNPGRRSIRLKGYDYSQDGAYFVTIVTQDRACLFGQVVDGEMRLNELGTIVWATWHDLPRHYPNVDLDAFVVMPNHVHGIIVLTPVGAGFKPAPTNAAGFKPAPTNATGFKPAPTAGRVHGLTEMVRAFKTFSARRINERRGTPGVRVWQRNYYEHIIRNDESLNRIREYIANNLLQWALDRENPDAAP